MAMLTVHSNPLTEPGHGDAGGMTVYVRQLAKSLAARGTTVDIFTRADTADGSVTELYPGVRVIGIKGGPTGITKEAVPVYLPEFTCNLTEWVRDEEVRYDLVHSHYWLSGRVAAKVAARWELPFVHTFHTLGLVKNQALRPGDSREPDLRLQGEAKVAANASAIVVSTHEERRWLIDLYAVDPERVHLITPGVDHRLFQPADRQGAKKALGLIGRTVLLYVGRLQPLKGADTAIRAFGKLISSGALDPATATLLIVGGASGMNGGSEVEALHRLAADLGLQGCVTFIPAKPQTALPAYYQAADVCIVPSHVESFGLVALEAQACGAVVVASDISGLRSIVEHGSTGLLARPGDADDFAAMIGRVISSRQFARKIATKAAARTSKYSWDSSAGAMHQLYATVPAGSLRFRVERVEAGINLEWSRRNVAR